MLSRCEKIHAVRFDETLSHSPYMKPLRMFFERRGRKFSWDLALEHDSVACVLYHRDRRCLLFVRQFRPPVFVRKVRRLPENIGKGVSTIDWDQYPISFGETIELCAGLMDKPELNPPHTMTEEILEECGYKVDVGKLFLLKKLIPSVSISGAQQYIYYAEIDDTMKMNEGGGNLHEGELIDKVFMTPDEARAYIEQENVVSPPSFLFAVHWFLETKLSTLPGHQPSSESGTSSKTSSQPSSEAEAGAPKCPNAAVEAAK